MAQIIRTTRIQVSKAEAVSIRRRAVGSIGGPRATPPPTFKISIIAAITGSTAGPSNPATDDWNIDKMETGALRCGYGWEKYRDKVLERYPAAATEVLYPDWDWPNPHPAIEYGTIYGTTCPTITFRGTALLHFLSLFDHVIIGHGCPPKVIQRIKTLSQVGTRVSLWCGSNWLETYAVYSGWVEPWRAAIRDAGGFNWGTADYIVHPGYQTVDPFEPALWFSPAFPRPNGGAPPQWPVAYPNGEGIANYVSGHLWYVNYGDATIRNVMAAKLRDMWDTYWGTNLPSLDGFMTDNYHGRRESGNVIWGYATNGPVRTKAAENANWQAYVTAVAAAFSGVSGGVGTLMGNTGGWGDTEGGLESVLKRQYLEHSFIKGDTYGPNENNPAQYYSQSQILAGLTKIKANGLDEIHVASRHPDQDSDHWTIPQFEPGLPTSSADHADLRAIRALAGTETNWYLCFHQNGGLLDTGGILYHGPTVRDII